MKTWKQIFKPLFSIFFLITIKKLDFFYKKKMDRSLPNILVTGTPGTGKTTTSEMIADVTGLQHVNVGEIIKTKQFHEGYLEEFDTHVLDEDKVIKKKD